ncbi:flagellin N-terminal helical domain-containing protein [Thiobacillus sedimenti]|uniref:Flagellin n=1 Tax=Thiobacillus sedimenti TaxID=3110231 RepID=A0ABZ1CN33_9PROT|nr:flagellin [Thiobacillus sp. SCUT-2]WRS40271.1 flagellin [Thiobacillus sp. SCUT-2]
MAQVINTNVAALFAGSALNRSNAALQTAQQRLSSGLRINSAKDDATGLGIATNFDAKVRGANMYIRNANDGISAAQTNDGYLAQITENTQRLREIFIQTKAVTNDEAKALIAENTRISGLVTADTAVTVDENGKTAGGAGTTFTAAATFANLSAFDTELTAINNARAKFGADMAGLSSAVATLQTASVNYSASFSRVMDTDYAAETAAQAKNNILQQAGMAVLAQANQNPQSVLTLLR